MRGGLRRVWPWLILVMGWVGVVWYAYPGFMAFDSNWQLLQARSGSLSDWHPPAMAELWRLTDAIVAGPFGMLVLQVTAFIAGTFLLLRRRLTPLVAASATVAITWFPPVGATLAVVWKDAQMMGYLVLGTALLLHEARRARIAGLVAMLLAALVRHNAFVHVGMLVVPLFVWSGELQGLRRYALSVGVWVAITLTAVFVNRALTDEQHHPWHSSLAMSDIAGTIRYSDATEPELREILSGVPLGSVDNIRDDATRAFSPVSGWFAVLNRGFMRQPSTEAERAAISHAWWTLVTSYPLAYLQQRKSAFGALLGLRKVVKQSFLVGMDPSLGVVIDDEPGPARSRVREWVLSLGTTWLVRPIVYLVLVLLCSAIAVWCRDRLVLALGVSAIISELSLFVMSPTPDFRYSIWLVVVAAVQLVYVSHMVRQRPRER